MESLPGTPPRANKRSRPETPPTAIISRDRAGNDMLHPDGTPMYDNQSEVDAAYAPINAMNDAIRSKYKMEMVSRDLFDGRGTKVHAHETSDHTLFYLVQLEPTDADDANLFHRWNKGRHTQPLFDVNGTKLSHGETATVSFDGVEEEKTGGRRRTRRTRRGGRRRRRARRTRRTR